MKTNYVIGLNSGTSFDGIDVALVKFKRGDLKPIFVDGIVVEYPKFIKEQIRQLINVAEGARPRLRKISRLHFLLGELFASAALKMIKKVRVRHGTPLLIASHGQTIFHDPGKSTLQIGESSVIAQKTGIKTISNFREADIAAGGQGAPLMPYLDWVMFNKSKNIKAVLNIGGIANVTIVGRNITPIAFDIGPGNALLDLISKKYFKKDFDKDGKYAAKGKVNYKLIEDALKDSYFKKRPPKSTGKEYFNLDFINKYFLKIKKREDKIATITYLTAKTIVDSLRKYNVKEIIISGGGVKNKTLMNHLRKLLPTLKIVISDKYDMPWKFKEAILLALLGYTCHLGIKNNMPACTGANQKVILGKLVNV